MAIFLATTEGRSGNPVLREWKANSKGQCRNLEAAPCRKARAMMLRALSSLRICVHDLSANPQKSSQINGMLSPISSTKGVPSRLQEGSTRPKIF